jgi:hypothetical protein
MHFSICQKVEVSTIPIKCKGNTNGSLTVNVSDFEMNYSIRILSSKNNRLINEKKDIGGNDEITFSNLKADKYKVQIISNGQVKEIITTIEEPEELKANIIEIENYPSTTENCDGIVIAKPSGGTKPYSYMWGKNTGFSTKQRIENLCEGTYRCKITDAQSCETVYATAFLYNKAMENE